MSDLSAHLLLRQACAETHARLDTLFSGFALDDAGHYADFLLAHARAALPLEAALDAAAFADALPDWPDRRRGTALLADLADLGIAAPAAGAMPTPTLGAAWGLAYVLEGSRLGGTVLARRLAPGLPRRYLGGEGPSSRWRDFLQALEAALRDEAARAVAVEAALAAFACFERTGRDALAAAVHIQPQASQSPHDSLTA